MEFRTIVGLPEEAVRIRPSDKILLMGSCFAGEVGARMLQDKLDCMINPFGVLYNPASMALALEHILDGPESFTPDDLFESGGLWHSWMHHGSFSAVSPEEALDLMNTSLRKARERVRELDVLVLTFGTNRCYVSRSAGRIVANCHKMPDREFSVLDLSVEKTVFVLTAVLDALRILNPDLQVILTVSPVRYAKYGFHGSQLSKAVLLCALDKLCGKFPDRVTYFPAYEILLDELRDYRFYAEDMIHPSSQAVDYIYGRFAESCFTQETRDFTEQWRKIRKGLQHRPLQEHSAASRAFLLQLLKQIEQLKVRYPHADLNKEIEQCHTRLKKLEIS